VSTIGFYAVALCEFHARNPHRRRAGEITPTQLIGIFYRAKKIHEAFDQVMIESSYKSAKHVNERRRVAA
jgi:hypothetical protein